MMENQKQYRKLSDRKLSQGAHVVENDMLLHEINKNIVFINVRKSLPGKFLTLMLNCSIEQKSSMILAGRSIFLI